MTKESSRLHLIDTHCHLNHEQLLEDVDVAVARAREADVREMIVVGYDMESSRSAVEIARRIPSVFAAVGIHPHDSRHYNVEAEAELRRLAADPRVVAVGEIGLDYHYDFSSRDDQLRAFRAQIALADEVGLPLILHCREAYADVLDLLEQEMPAGMGCVMHCWAGSGEEAERALALGCHLGFGGVLTFKNAEENRRVAAVAPLNRIVLETDAPYLAPVPHRGKRNEPAYARLAAEKLAEIRGIPLEEVAAATTDNVLGLFPRMEPAASQLPTQRASSSESRAEPSGRAG
jgi:TatD DNase family protein